VGTWFLSSGFFVAENQARGHALDAMGEVWKGLVLLAGSMLPWVAIAGAVLVLLAFVRSAPRSTLIVPLALAAAATLPWYAYYEGHPVRVRYDLPLVAAAAAIVGAAIGLLPRGARMAVAVAVVTVVMWQASPFDGSAPVLKESQRDVLNSVERRAVTAYLHSAWDRQPIMMSMGSLSHYMHDLSREGYTLSDFVHEGTGEIWKYALAHPRPYVEWITVEEKAEGGDVLYWQGQRDSHFFDGYDRVAAGGGIALYRRRR
jgi:hypothetical protein